jgi:hypothetical protein
MADSPDGEAGYARAGAGLDDELGQSSAGFTRRDLGFMKRARAP